MLKISGAKLLVLLLLGLLFPRMVHAANVTLAWDPNTEPNVAGYKVRYGTASGVYNQVIDTGTSLTANVSGLVRGTTYYFVVTAYNSANLESAPSGELAYTPPSDPLADDNNDGLPDMWQSLHGLTGSSQADGADGDPDHDGTNNFLEYAFDLDPRISGPSPLPRPQLVQDPADGNWYLIVSLRRRSDDPRLDYRVERSSQLTTWAPAEVQELQTSTPNPGGMSDTVSLRILPAIDPSSTTPAFVRVVAKLNTGE